MKAIRYKLSVSDGIMGAVHGAFWTITEYFFPDVGLVLNREGVFLCDKPRYVKDAPEEGMSEFSMNPNPEPDPEPEEIEVGPSMECSVRLLAAAIKDVDSNTDFLRSRLYEVDIAQEDACVEEARRNGEIWDEKVRKIVPMLKEKHMGQYVAIEDTPEGIVVVDCGESRVDLHRKVKGRYDALFEVTEEWVKGMEK